MVLCISDFTAVVRSLAVLCCCLGKWEWCGITFLYLEGKVISLVGGRPLLRMHFVAFPGAWGSWQRGQAICLAQDVRAVRLKRLKGHWQLPKWHSGASGFSCTHRGHVQRLVGWCHHSPAHTVFVTLFRTIPTKLQREELPYPLYFGYKLDNVQREM